MVLRRIFGSRAALAALVLGMGAAPSYGQTDRQCPQRDELCAARGKSANIPAEQVRKMSDRQRAALLDRLIREVDPDACRVRKTKQLSRYDFDETWGAFCNDQSPVPVYSVIVPIDKNEKSRVLRCTLSLDTRFSCETLRRKSAS